ncbi:hypothetical protein B0O80DRAFT_116035 [Mortierella sp. GBAus27b]|nr:hypothetical protein B0O80DRAFT_116035 [Mortierella sp. GBAus27b]
MDSVLLMIMPLFHVGQLSALLLSCSTSFLVQCMCSAVSARLELQDQLGERGFPQSCKSLCCFPRREKGTCFLSAYTAYANVSRCLFLAQHWGPCPPPHSLLSHPNSILSDKKEGCVCLPQLTVSFVPSIPLPRLHCVPPCTLTPWASNTDMQCGRCSLLIRIHELIPSSSHSQVFCKSNQSIEGKEHDADGERQKGNKHRIGALQSGSANDHKLHPKRSKGCPTNDSEHRTSR